MGNIVAFGVHIEPAVDPMATSISSGFMGDRPTGGGIPSFWIGDEAGDDQSLMTALMNKVPEAGVDLVSTNLDDLMQVKVQVKFFANVTGDYYVNVYLLESGIDGGPEAPSDYIQTGGGAGFMHNHVLRCSGSSTSYGGELIGQGNIASGTTFDTEFFVGLDSEWVSANLRVAAVIWKFDVASPAPQFKYINAILK